MVIFCQQFVIYYFTDIRHNISWRQARIKGGTFSREVRTQFEGSFKIQVKIFEKNTWAILM